MADLQYPRKTPRLPRSAYADKLRAFSDIAFAEQAAFDHRGRWNDYFQQRIGTTFNGQIIFEIGCFDAGYLCKIAAKFPHIAFIGLDWKCKALYDGARQITERGLRNIVLLRARAQDIAQIFAEREIDEVWVFHPDPCDRPAERNNRLIAEPFLMDAHHVLKPTNSRLVLKTDHAAYYQGAVGLFEAIDSNLSQCSKLLPRRFTIAARSTNFWNDPATLAHTAGRYFASETTLFESRFRKKHLPIYFLEMRPLNSRDPAV